MKPEETDQIRGGHQDQRMTEEEEPREDYNTEIRRENCNEGGKNHW